MRSIKMIITRSLPLLLCGLVLFSCSEEEISTFSGGSNVYFSLKKWTPYSQSGKDYNIYDFPVGEALYSEKWNVTSAMDSLSVSLAFDGTDEGYRVILIPVSISGNVADYDRPLGYTVEKTSTAVQGEHFEVDAFIPADSIIGAIAVSVKRSALKDTVLTADFTLVANEHFQTNYTTINRSSVDTTKVNMQQFRLRVSGFVEIPPNWNTRMRNYLGEFSRKKMYLISELTGFDVTVFYLPTTDLGQMIAFGKTLKLYLHEQKALGKTVYEEDGVTEMTAGPLA